MREYYSERRSRGVVGWFFLLLFLGWNIAMLFAMLLPAFLAPAAPDIPEIAKVGGHALYILTLLPVWALGSIITGILAMVTRSTRRHGLRKSRAPRIRMPNK